MFFIFAIIVVAASKYGVEVFVIQLLLSNNIYIIFIIYIFCMVNLNSGDVIPYQ